MKKHFLSVCAALFALMVLFPATVRAADTVYAILYDNGTLTFQQGNTAESGKTVTKTYEVDLNKTYNYSNGKSTTPWYDERKSVTAVNFADKISPGATAYWFLHCSNLKRVDNIQNLDTKNVTNMNDMFFGCSGLTALDVSKFDTKNVTSMYGMFTHCSGLTALDVSKFDTKNVTDMSWMFYGCSKLKLICASDKFTTASVTSSFHMFNGCTSLIGGNGTKYDDSHVDKAYARIDTLFSPGYFTAPGTNPTPTPEPTPETCVITSYAGEGGTVTPAGDTRVNVGASQKYVMTPNPGYRVLSVRMDNIEIGALSEYVFQNVVKDHSLIVSFEKIPRYAITAATAQKGKLSVTLENDGAVTVAVWYFDQNGQFLSADMQNVSANAGSVTFALPFAYAARVALFDSDCRPLCEAVTVD